MSSDAQTGFSSHFDACFVGLKCYDLLRGESIPKYLGGIERALVSLAKGMASLGHKVAFIEFIATPLQKRDTICLALINFEHDEHFRKHQGCNKVY